jgi:RHS repeat-associated protein
MCEKQKARHTLRIEFIYDATGAKLRKTVFENNAAIETRDYINGKEYKGGVLDRFAHTEGAVVRNENTVFEHQYVIKDHLGNARITYRDGINKVDNTGNTTLNDGTIVAADMMQINHYYPFGMNMEGNWNGLNGKNKYQYNEKELNSDFGLNWNDYGARMYDGAIGRWNGVDLLAEKYVAHTPYNYVMNNPTNFVDPNGMAVEFAKPNPGISSELRNLFNMLSSNSNEGSSSGSGYKQKKESVPDRLVANINAEHANGTDVCYDKYGCYGAVYLRLLKAYQDVIPYKFTIIKNFSTVGIMQKDKVGNAKYDRWYPDPRNSDFNKIFGSNVDSKDWMDLPNEYRAKGAAGAIAYAKLGELVNDNNLGSGLKPGAVLQIWRTDGTWDKVFKGKTLTDGEQGHSAIFLGYNQDGTWKIADQYGINESYKISPGWQIFGANLYPQGERLMPYINIKY